MAVAGRRRRLGLHFALEPGVLALEQWPAWRDTGIAQITLDGRLLHGSAGDSALHDAVRALATLAHALDWQVVVDGAADDAEAARLLALGCDGVALAAGEVTPSPPA